MRLSDQYIAVFISVLNEFLENKSAELRLYGSRANDELKGGDIDLLLVTEDEHLAEQILDKKFRILAKFKMQLGEQKIDFGICERSKIETDPFYKVIYPDSVVIHTWSI